MQRTESPLVVIAICLAALAGFVDALAFTSLGGFFASFMSGNTTRMAVGLGNDMPGVAAVAGALVMSFISGVILAAVVTRWRQARFRESIMALVTLLLVIAATLASLMPGPLVLIFLAMAMGCENGILHREGEVTVGVTYMTGSLVKLGQGLAGALMGDPDRWAWTRYLFLWLGFVAGAVMGAASHGRWGWTALWLAPIASAVLAFALLRVRPKLSGPWAVH
ncbi:MULTISPECIES: YoaK family protein [unclassified Sphingomonas]|uniref:YoaK family protein n=1 Tax=unclassified Sphingomonas TaxID=196159 RepID=UPI0022B50EE9|nr:YoaK family protein [Sphingomonas sp. NIBR02145]WHU02035.1 YoaK family protein [Sphingomonas sp. NIBR02145]